MRISGGHGVDTPGICTLPHSPHFHSGLAGKLHKAGLAARTLTLDTLQLSLAPTSQSRGLGDPQTAQMLLRLLSTFLVGRIMPNSKGASTHLHVCLPQLAEAAVPESGASISLNP